MNTQLKTTILAVDDDRTMLAILNQKLSALNYDVVTARDGSEALKILQDDYRIIDVVVLDREMPDMNGLQVTAEMQWNANLKRIPVIMLTGSDKPEQIQEGIDAGVFYYLTKPINDSILRSVISAAVRESSKHRILDSELKKHKASFSLIDNCTINLRTLQEAEDIACFLANCFPDPDRVILGISELLVNAVEHGNLGIGYDEKTMLIEQNTWHEEVIRRVDEPQHKNKLVSVMFFKRNYGYYLKVKDSGNGFNWRKFLDVDPARANDNHGRGIAQANAISFDKLVYNDIGNEATAFVSNEGEVDW